MFKFPLQDRSSKRNWSFSESQRRNEFFVAENIASMQSFLILSFNGHAGVVNSTVIDMLFPSTDTFFIMFSVTRSRCKSGSFTRLSELVTLSFVIEAIVSLYCLISQFLCFCDIHLKQFSRKIDSFSLLKYRIRRLSQRKRLHFIPYILQIPYIIMPLIKLLWWS